MKKLFGLLLIAIIALSSCADSKTFERADGTKFVAEPYGWANSFIDCLEDRADVMGLCITEKSKKELLQHLKELVIKLVSEL